MQVEYDPSTLIVGIEYSQFYFLLLMNDSVIAPMICRLVHPKILDPYFRI